MSALLTAALLLAPTEAALAADLRVSMTYPNVQVTHYSATPKGGKPCRLEGGNGGPDESPSGLRPLAHTLQAPGAIRGRRATLAAVPQKGGNSGIFGCFFSIKSYPGKLFFAGDRYGKGSNYKVKVDISSVCDSTVKRTLRSEIVVYDCPGKRGGMGREVQRASARVKQVQKRETTPRKRAPARSRASASAWRQTLWQQMAENGG